MKQLSSAELSLIRGMVDELVVNHGILDLKNLKISMADVDVRRLAKVAFLYYRLMIEGNQSFEFSDIEKFLHLRDTEFADSADQRKCLACGSVEDIAVTPESTFLPLCQSCRTNLDTDIKKMSLITHE